MAGGVAPRVADSSTPRGEEAAADPTGSSQPFRDKGIEKMQHCAMWCFYWMAWVNGLATSVLLPSLWPFTAALGGGSAEYGVLVSSFGVLSFFSNVIFGRLSDRPGARGRVLAATFVVGGVGSLIYAFTASPWGSHSWVQLLVGRSLMGVGDGRCSIIAASVTEMSAPRDLAARNAQLSMSTLLGNSLGPLVGLWLNMRGRPTGFEGPPLILACAMFLNAALALGVPAPRHGAPEGGAEAAPLLPPAPGGASAPGMYLPGVVFMMASHAVFWFCWYAFEVLMPVVADREFSCAVGRDKAGCLSHDATNLNAYLFAGFSVVGVLSYVSVRPLVRVASELRILTFHAVLFAAAACAMARRYAAVGPLPFPVFVCGAVAIIVSFTQGEALNSAVFSTLIPRDALGRWQGYFTCVGALAPAAGAFVMTRVYHDEGRSSFLILAVAMAALAAALAWMRRDIQRVLEAQQETHAPPPPAEGAEP